MRRVLFRERIESYFKMISYRKERFLADFLITMTFVSGFALVGSAMQRTRATGVDELTGSSYGCTITSTVTSEHTAVIGLGESVNDFGTTKITTICENSNEHQIYAIGYSNNSEGNTNLIRSGSDITIPTGITTGNVSNWSMKISRDENSFLYRNLDIQNGFDSNHVVPNESTMISSYLGGTDSTTGSSIFTTYSARVSSSQIAGNYLGKVKYTLVATTTAGITIKTNTGISKVRLGNKECTSSEGCLITGLVTGEVLELVAELEDGYYFENWAAVEEGVIGDNTIASTTYTVGQNSETLTPSAKPKIQNIDASQCTTTPAVFYDERDGHAYTIQRLLDGKCWMMENLDLGRTTLTKDLTSENTNLETTIPANTFNEWKKTTSSGTYNAGELISVDGSDSISGTAYGTLYNYYAASAGTIYGSNVTEDSKYDICPAGWRLPTGGTGGEYETLYTHYNSPELIRASVANNGAAFGLAGYFSASGGAAGQEADGRYWTSSNYNERQMINFGNRPQEVVPTAVRGRNLGDSIRCVLKKQISDLEYMQDFNSLTESEYKSVSQSMKNRTAYQLVDNRDNRTYEVAKLPDGRIWMANNLDLGRTPIGTNLTSDNTNVASTNTITSATFNGWRGAQSTSGNAVNPVPTQEYGTLYNFNAAVARTGYGAGFFASQDLCPAGWRLPIGTSHGEYVKLSNLLGISNLRKAVAEGGGNFNYAGKIMNNEMQNQGSEGTFWTNAGHMDYMIYILTISSSYTSAGDAYQYMMNSFSVRCTAKQKPTQVITLSIGTGVSSVKINGITVTDGGTIELEQGTTYMIEAELDSGYGFDEWSVSNAEIGSPKTQYTTIELNDSPVTLSVSALATNTNLQNLAPENCGVEPISAIDSRDGQIYVIQRLKDGNCWFMDNLNLGQTNLTDDLTSSNTNIVDTVTAATFNGWTKYKNAGRDPVSGARFGVHYAETTARAGGASGSEYDICPAGWRLPVTNEYTSLVSLYKADNRRIPAHEGGLAHADAVMRSSGTTSWTVGVSTVYYWTQGGYYSNSSSTTYSPSLSVRCILKQKLEHQITFVADAGVESISIDGSTLEGTSINLFDNKDYTISINLKPGYALSNWTSTSGTIEDVNSRITKFSINGSNATITVNTTSVATTMQNLSDESCTNTQSFVKDSRDNQVYAIKRLADGNCWMVSNLNLGAIELNTDLTSSNTNLEETITANTFNGWKQDSATSEYETGVYIPVGGMDATSKIDYGTLYNYYAATAGTVSGSTNSNDAVYDICPAGWRLPTNGDNGEFKLLYNNPEYGTIAKARASTQDNGLAFSLSGNFSTGAASGKGSNGYYWSSTRSSDTAMYTLYFSSTSSTLNNTRGRNQGSSVRCILKKNVKEITIKYSSRVQSVKLDGETVQNNEKVYLEKGKQLALEMIPINRARAHSWNSTTGNINYNNPKYAIYTVGENNATITAEAMLIDKEIQNVTDQDCTGVISYAIDNRDDQIYSIKRLKDGNCWMMENLNLGKIELENDLTPSNTNLANTVTAETFNGWLKTETSTSYENGQFIVLDEMDNVSDNGYGTLYNYYAATAGTISGSTNNNNAQYDICPAGWRLPNNNKEFGNIKKLSESYSVSQLRDSEANGGAAFAMPGYFISQATYSKTYGYYWTSNSVNDTSVASLRFYYYNGNTTISEYNQLTRYYGSSIRCLKKKPLKTITFSYGTGITEILINGQLISNGNTIELEQDEEYEIIAKTEVGYGFNNWSATSGTIKEDNSKITRFVVGSSNSTITASAAQVTKIVQNLTDANCSTTPSYAKDNRDNQVYVIQELSDGNCWMMENLRLGEVTLNTDLTSSNTNLATTITSSTFNGWKKTTGESNYENGVYIAIDGYDTNSKTDRGILYNFYAASAGTTTGSSVSTSATYDLCPAGWRLPTGNTTGEAKAIYDKFGSYAMATAPALNNGLALALSGTFTTSNPTNVGNYGYYWTSTRYSNTAMYSLNLTSSAVSSSYTARTNGASIRCIKNSTMKISDFTYLQDFIGLNANKIDAIKKTMVDSTVYNKIDNRDNKTYGVALFKDNKIWLAENLNLGATTLSNDLTIENTNLADTITAATFNSWKITAPTGGTYTNGEFMAISGTDPTSNNPYGVIYNYCAASANTECASSATPSNKNIPYDLCPRGWRMASGTNASGELGTFRSSGYNSVANLQKPVSQGGAGYSKPGNFNLTTYSGTDTATYYWSRTIAQTQTTWIYSLSGGYNNINRRWGGVIRCTLNE